MLVSYKLADSIGSSMVKPMLVDVGHSLTAIGTLALMSSITGMIAADGMSTVALFALMMEQCRTCHEGADYSLQVILGGLVGATSGWLASQLGYQLHFIAAGLRGLLMLVFAWNVLRQHPQLQAGRRVAPGA